jgi:hypothetical protein
VVDLFNFPSDITLTSNNPEGDLPLAPSDGYTFEQSVTIPSYVEAGEYYLLFVNDIYNSQSETNRENNIVVVPFTVTERLPSDVDLVTSVVSTPRVATAGSQIDLSWKVTNQGTETTDAPYWFDYVLLSTDTVVDFLTFPDPSDTTITLYNPTEKIPLAAGESYTVNQSGTIPDDIAPGLYYLLFVNNIYNFQEDTNQGNDVVVVPFSVVESSMTGTTASDLLVGTDASELIEALGGRDEIMAGGGDDVIVGGTGGDTLTGGAAADRFIYRTLQDMGDTIADFTIDEDEIDLGELLDSFGYQGGDPVTDGYLRWVQGSNGTSVQVDTDGSIGRGLFRPFIFLENVAASDLSASDFIV